MIYPPFIYARKWNSRIEGKVASRLFFLMQIIEVFTRRFPGVLLEAAAEITRVVESRAISDFGDAHPFALHDPAGVFESDVLDEFVG